MPDEMNKREVILTIREYENSVAMPEGERVTYLDLRGGVEHLNAAHIFAAEALGHSKEADAVARAEPGIHLLYTEGQEGVYGIGKIVGGAYHASVG